MKKFALVLLFVSMNSVAADIKNLVFVVDNEKKSCLLTEFGYAVITNPVKLEGKYYGPDECGIHLTADDFSKKFDYCALSGLEIFRPENPIECKVTYAKSKWVEFTKRGDINCNFVCTTKSSK